MWTEFIKLQSRKSMVRPNPQNIKELKKDLFLMLFSKFSKFSKVENTFINLKPIDPEVQVCV